MRIMRIKDYADVFSGYAFSSGDLVEDGIPVIKIGNIQDGSVSRDCESFYCNSIDARLEKYVLTDGDFLIAMTGAGSVGRAGRMLNIDKTYLVNQRVAVVRANGNANSYYIYYFFRLPFVEQYLYSLGIGAGQPNISAHDILNVKVSFPSKRSQDIASAFLLAYDNLIEINNKRIKVLEQMAENLYKEWFVRFRFPGHETAEFENGIPKGWTERRLGETMSFIRGVSYSSSDIADGDTVLLSMNNVRPWGGYIADYSRVYSGKYKENQVINEDDLLMSITDMTQDRRIIGYVGIASPSNKKRVICTHLMKITSSTYSNYFLYGLFTYSGLSRHISEYATGANVLGLTADILKRIKCRFPDKGIAALYSDKVSPVFKEIHKIEQVNDNLIKQRDLLLPRLMSGKLEV